MLAGDEMQVSSDFQIKLFQRLEFIKICETLQVFTSLLDINKLAQSSEELDHIKGCSALPYIKTKMSRKFTKNEQRSFNECVGIQQSKNVPRTHVFAPSFRPPCAREFKI